MGEILVNNKGLKILLISPLPPPAGGIASWTQKYLKWAEQNKIQVDLVNNSVIGKRRSRVNSGRSFLEEIRRTRRILMDLKKRIYEGSLDIVHLNSSCGKYGIIRDYLCARIIKEKDIYLVVHYHCNIEDQIKNRRVQKFFFRKLARRADVNLVLNNNNI